MIPETDTSVEELVGRLTKAAQRGKLFSVVVVAEGNQNGDAAEMAAAVKEKLDLYETKVTVIGHLQRGGSPTCQDRMLASRLGHAAVEALLVGKGNTTVGIVNNQVVFTPFAEAIAGEKAIDSALTRMAVILGM